jgi:hypothetical protein
MASRIYYDNLWDDYTVTASSEHSNFPDDNTQHRDLNKCWRSLYGAGSGWGTFLIEAGVNDKIDFEETGATPLVATLTAGTYNADTLAAEIETQLEASGASDYTVTYSDSTNKFTLTSDGAGGAGLFRLFWSTGANQGTSVANDIGFFPGADDVGALTYEADFVRIHTHESLTMDLGSAQNINAVIVRNHNLALSGSVARIEFSADNFASVAESQAMTVQADIMLYIWTTAKSYQYVRIWLEDVDGDDRYLMVGRVYVGGHFEPTNTFLEETQYIPLDPSTLKQSEDGQYSSIQLTHYWKKQYGYIMGASDKSTFESVFTEVGTTKGLFFCEDTGSYLTTTDYVKFTSFQLQSLLHSVDTWRLDIEMEKLR